MNSFFSGRLGISFPANPSGTVEVGGTGCVITSHLLPNSSGTATLFTMGCQAASSGISLYTSGTAHSGVLSTTTLFTHGCLIAASSTPLFTEGAQSTNGSTTLFIHGEAIAESWLPLFLRANDVPSESASIFLTVFGNNASGMFGGTTLHIYADDNANIVVQSMPLYLDTVSRDSTCTNMNLWVSGKNRSVCNSATLFVNNQQSGVNNTASLFVQGLGTLDGALPCSSSMNLFLGRRPAEMATLFISGPGQPESGVLNLSILGAQSVSDTTTLCVPSSIGGQSLTSKLYVNGF